MTTKRKIKNIIFILDSTLLISACGQKSSNETGHTNNQTQISVDSTQSNNNSKTLDSIDNANNESVIASGDNINKAYVSLQDSSIEMRASMRLDHRIFGYAKPDTKSERPLLLAVFTNDVENNPFGCKLGSYYDTGGMENIKLKYVDTLGTFVKAVAIDKLNKATTLYFEKKWIMFE